MKLKTITQLFSLRDLRNAILGVMVVFGGIGLSLLTLYAHRTQQPRLAGIAAGISLVFVLLILIFVVPPLARNAGREASQMNLPFEFTVGGAIMLVLIVIVGFSAWNTGNNLLFLVLSFLTAAMIVGFAAGNLCLKKLDVKMRFPETIFAGEKTPILVSLHNRKKIFPSYSVIAEVRGKQRERSVAADDLERILPKRIANWLSRPPIIRRTLNYFVHIPRQDAVENKASYIFPERGRFLIKDFELSTRFPLAFFRHRRRLPARETDLIVFPKLEPLDREIENLTLESGNLAVNKRGLGQDLLALRDYQPNDDLRRIDWKATARTRHLTVREFSAEDDKRVTLLLDRRVPNDSKDKKTLRQMIEAEQKGETIILSERFEIGVGKAASLLSYFTEEQAEIRLIIGNKQGEFGIGSRHLYASLKRLAVAEPVFVDTAKAPHRLLEIFDDHPNSYNFFITACDASTIPKELQKINIIGF